MADSNNVQEPIRCIFTINTIHKAKIDSLAKTYKITQGEVIEVLLDRVSVTEKDDDFIAKREGKINSRSKHLETEKALLEKIKSLTPEQIAKLLAA